MPAPHIVAIVDNLGYTYCAGCYEGPEPAKDEMSYPVAVWSDSYDPTIHCESCGLTIHGAENQRVRNQREG